MTSAAPPRTIRWVTAIVAGVAGMSALGIAALFVRQVVIGDSWPIVLSILLSLLLAVFLYSLNDFFYLIWGQPRSRVLQTGGD